MLVHFCGRPLGTATNPDLAAGIAQMTAEERLTSILWDRTIRGSAPFRGGPNTVSFSEVSGPHLHWLIYSRGFPPWGLIFDRQAIFNAGGGPVWYARRGQAGRAIEAGLSEWVVPYDTTPGIRSDWVHEQEWRLPCDELPATLESGLRAVLVGRPDWWPIRTVQVPTGDLLQADGSLAVDPSDGVYPEVRPEQRFPWGWPLQRMMPNPATGELWPLPFQ